MFYSVIYLLCDFVAVFSEDDDIQPNIAPSGRLAAAQLKRNAAGNAASWLWISETSGHFLGE